MVKALVRRLGWEKFWFCVLAIIAVLFGILTLISCRIYLPVHNISIEDIESNPAYWNMAWIKRGPELKDKVQTLNSAYYLSHTYIAGETDCNDMVIDLWNMLHTQGITSIIAIGNHERTGERFNYCNHAWLLVFNCEGASFVLEPTNGNIYFAGDIIECPELKQYWEGFFYVKPSDLKADVREGW